MTPFLEAQVALPPRLAPTQVVASPGERIAIVGPNGSGKTSLLRALAGIELGKADAATTIGGEPLQFASPARRRRLLAFLPASRDVPWPIPVRDLIALGLDQPDPARIAELLDLLELESFADRPIDRLSTGERARVLLARALAARPGLLLLDEPLSNLDPAWALRILDLLDKEVGRGATLLLSLHDLTLLGRFDRVLLMDGGALRFDGAPATLLGSARFGEVFGVEPDAAGWRLRPREDPRSSP